MNPRSRHERLAVLIGAGAILAACQGAFSAGFMVDHRHIPLFEQIPPEYVAAARNLRVLFSDRSVGQNTYQFSYLNVDANDDIADPATGFFADRPDRYDLHNLETFLAQHPDKTFFFWTTSLARGIGTQTATDFNEQMREYCRANDRILFDVADILSRDADGNVCFDNRDGVPYSTPNGASENHPDDGYVYPAICQDYTTEVDGGHLGSVSGGKIRIAKAMWVLMARIAGWQPPAVPGDADADQSDFALLQRCISGTGVPGHTGCDQ